MTNALVEMNKSYAIMVCPFSESDGTLQVLTDLDSIAIR